MQGGLKINGNNKKSEINLPLVSIITVVLNGQTYLDQTINSVINQTYKNIEYIIIDGKSTDQSLDIIKNYDSKIDYWISEKDSGLYDAMNKGISLANGDIIGILNADDFYNINAVELVVDSFLKSNSDIVHGNMNLLSFEKQTIMIPDFELLKKQPSIFHPTCFVKKVVYNSIGLFNTKFKISADYDFLLRCLNNKFVFNYVPYVITNFRYGGMSSSCYSNIEGFKIMKLNKTGYHWNVAWRAVKCYLKVFVKNMINLQKK